MRFPQEKLMLERRKRRTGANAIVVSFLLLLPLLAVSWPAAAQAPQAIQAFIKRANPSCDIEKYREIYHGQLSGSNEPVTVATFGIVSCDGGNNWSSEFGIFAENGGTVHEWQQTPAPKGEVSDVAVRNGRVTVRSLSYKPSDPHCCPSVRSQTVYILRNGRAVPTI
jgi:hypothetical protein